MKRKQYFTPTTDIIRLPAHLMVISGSDPLFITSFDEDELEMIILEDDPNG